MFLKRQFPTKLIQTLHVAELCMVAILATHGRNLLLHYQNQVPKNDETEAAFD